MKLLAVILSIVTLYIVAAVLDWFWTADSKEASQ